MRALDRTSMVRSHRGRWVALKADRKTVVASGGSADAVLRAAQRKGCTDPVITRMPKNPRNFIGVLPSL